MPPWFVNGSITMQGVYSAPATPPNTAGNDSITVGATVSLVLAQQITPITVETLVDGVVTSSRTTNFYGTNPPHHADVRGFYTWSQTGNPPGTALGPFMEAGGSTHTYIVEALSASGVVLATSGRALFTAPSVPKPVVPTAMKAWETNYGNALNARLTPDVAAIQADLKADALTPGRNEFPANAAQRADQNKLYNDVLPTQTGAIPAPPITTNALWLLEWKQSAANLYLASRGVTFNSTDLAQYNINIALSDLTASGEEW